MTINFFYFRIAPGSIIKSLSFIAIRDSMADNEILMASAIVATARHFRRLTFGGLFQMLAPEHCPKMCSSLKAEKCDFGRKPGTFKAKFFIVICYHLDLSLQKCIIQYDCYCYGHKIVEYNLPYQNGLSKRRYLLDEKITKYAYFIRTEMFNVKGKTVQNNFKKSEYH